MGGEFCGSPPLRWEGSTFFRAYLLVWKTKIGGICEKTKCLLLISPFFAFFVKRTRIAWKNLHIRHIFFCHKSHRAGIVCWEWGLGRFKISDNGFSQSSKWKLLYSILLSFWSGNNDGLLGGNWAFKVQKTSFCPLNAEQIIMICRNFSRFFRAKDIDFAFLILSFGTDLFLIRLLAALYGKLFKTRKFARPKVFRD